MEKVREALEGASLALDDWLNVYAPELCDEQRVKEARKRIGEHGTLAYIATVQQTIRAALASLSPNAERGDVEAAVLAERERCAKVVDDYRARYGGNWPALESVATAIRFPVDGRGE